MKPFLNGRLTGARLALAAACTLGASGALAAPGDAGIPPGMWSGGYGALTGEAPEWHTLIVDLEVDGDRISGTLRRDDGRIRGKLKKGIPSLILSHEGRRLFCDARLEEGALIGSCRGGDRPFTLQLVHEQEPSEKTMETLAGLYETEGGGLIAIRKSIHLIMNDLESGAVRVLYAEGPDRFTAGERLAVPRPAGLRLSFERDDTGNASAVTIEDARGGKRRATRCCPHEIEEFTFENDGITLAGSLYLPPGAGPHPAVVYVHGSGMQTRAGAGTWPQFLISRGFAVLAYDKRGQGNSGGRYRLPGGGRDNQPHMKRRSTDVVAAVKALKTRRDIDGRQVGLVGGSQAGWVMPMASESGEVAFTVTISGGATELSVEGRFSALADEDGSGGTPVEEIIARLRKHEPDDYDFRPHFRAQKVPGLWLYGGKDRSNPAVLCVELIEQVREEAGNDFEVVLFPDGNHSLFQAVAGGAAETYTLAGRVPGLHATVSDWLTRKGFGPGPAKASADVVPE